MFVVEAVEGGLRSFPTLYIIQQSYKYCKKNTNGDKIYVIGVVNWAPIPFSGFVENVTYAG